MRCASSENALDELDTRRGAETLTRLHGKIRAQLRAKLPVQPVDRDLDGVRLEAEQLGNLARGEIGAVAERDELALTVREAGDRRAHGEDVGSLLVDVNA